MVELNRFGADRPQLCGRRSQPPPRPTPSSGRSSSPLRPSRCAIREAGIGGACPLWRLTGAPTGSAHVRTAGARARRAHARAAEPPATRPTGRPSAANAVAGPRDDQEWCLDCGAARTVRRPPAGDTGGVVATVALLVLLGSRSRWLAVGLGVQPPSRDGPRRSRGPGASAAGAAPAEPARRPPAPPSSPPPTAPARPARSRPRARRRPARRARRRHRRGPTASSPRTRPRSPCSRPADRRVGVEAGRDQHQLRRERPRQRHRDVVDQRAEQLVAGPGRDRQVDGVARRRRRSRRRSPDRCPGTAATGGSRRTGPAGRRAKMSLVPLPWWTSQSRIITRSSPRRVERVARRDRDVVEQAEAHRPRRGRRGGRAAGGR